jgi:quinol monooxygenase YgiN
MPGTEIGADMSGRRRRDDGWDEGRPDRDVPDSRRDPWADAGADGRGGGGYAAPSFQPMTEQATSYDLGGGRGGSANGYDSPGYEANGYGGRAGYGSQNGSSANGYQNSTANGYQSGSANGYQNGSANGYQSGQSAPGYGGGYEANGYGDSGSGQGGYGYGNESGYGGGRAGFADANGATAFVPEFMAPDADEASHGIPVGTPRPIGRLSIYTLLDDKVAEFDRLAERAAEGVRTSEPDTLVYVIHVVPKAPLQRIVYEIYRDRAAFASHERQPHIQRFMADRASCVLATNIIDLRLKYAKVAALGAAPAAEPAGQAPWPDAQPAPRTAGPAAAEQSRSDQYASQYGNDTQYNGSQYANGREYANGSQLHPRRRGPLYRRRQPVRGGRVRPVRRDRPVRLRGGRPVRRRQSVPGRRGRCGVPCDQRILRSRGLPGDRLPGYRQLPGERRLWRGHRVLGRGRLFRRRGLLGRGGLLRRSRVPGQR